MWYREGKHMHKQPCIIIIIYLVHLKVRCDWNFMYMYVLITRRAIKKVLSKDKYKCGRDEVCMHNLSPGKDIQTN